MQNGRRAALASSHKGESLIPDATIAEQRVELAPGLSIKNWRRRPPVFVVVVVVIVRWPLSLAQPVSLAARLIQHQWGAPLVFYFSTINLNDNARQIATTPSLQAGNNNDESIRNHALEEARSWFSFQII